jgi:hypothetical protein
MDSGDIGTLSSGEAERCARHYMARAGIVPPPGARLVRSVGGVYRFDYDAATDATDATPLLQILIDPSDGRLLLLANCPTPRSR